MNNSASCRRPRRHLTQSRGGQLTRGRGDSTAASGQPSPTAARPPAASHYFRYATPLMTAGNGSLAPSTAGTPVYLVPPCRPLACRHFPVLRRSGTTWHSPLRSQTLRDTISRGLLASFRSSSFLVWREAHPLRRKDTVFLSPSVCVEPLGG